MRPFVTAANWKMNKGPRESLDFLKSFIHRVPEAPKGSEIIFFPPAINLWVVQQALNGLNISFGVQNAHQEKSGAFTGENSMAVVKEIGGRFVLIGHSERRSLFNESNEQIALKIKAAHEAGLVPLLCVGESLDERKSMNTFDVIKTQLDQGCAPLESLSAERPLYIAYEPVWAIGTGQVASPEQANEVHVFIREWLTNRFGEASNSTPILYGGSVKPDNAEALRAQSEIDGFLVGGASLDVESFVKLCVR